ncbi:FkbM family methyltransferase [Candidatus Planktophila dulcis]|uniref:FkbM family methyltransferase n=1 Tax=Candidatus Planktophila dulcis TaxID=1884914 RepID=UPI003CEF26EE
MDVKKALQRVVTKQLEEIGINLSRNTTTTGLTPKNEVLSLLRRIRPQDNGHKLIRVGGPGDGGYLIPDDVTGISECFSPGSNKLSNFESEIADRWQIKSYICDSIEEKPSDLTAFQDFTEAWVGPATDGENYISLTHWVEEKSQSQGDLILQMDIEGAEFLTVLAASKQLLKRFRMVVIELHFLEALKNRWAYDQIYLPFFDKLLKEFDVVHLHPNNCCGTWSYGDFEFPRIIELTLHRKDRSIYLRPVSSSRNELDYPCVDSSIDLSLNFSEFGNRITVEWD